MSNLGGSVMSNGTISVDNLIPIAEQSATLGIPVPVGKTAKQIRAMGFVVPDDVRDNDRLEVDTYADKSKINTEDFGRLTGYVWEMFFAWREYDFVWQIWCGSVCAKVTFAFDPSDNHGWSVYTSIEALGWVQNNVAVDMKTAEVETEKFVRSFYSRFSTEQDHADITLISAYNQEDLRAYKKNQRPCHLDQ